jgi:hypothetical protein
MSRNPEDWKALLRLGDPAREMSADETERVRRRMAAAGAGGRPERAPRWGAWATAAAAAALALALGLWRGTPAPQIPPAPAVIAEAPAPRRYQIDFATPGGTRIIWTLTPEQAGERSNR